MKIEHLGKCTDKTGVEVNVKYCDEVEQSPVLGLLFRTVAKLLDNNLSPAKFYWNKLPQAKAVWIENDCGEVMSTIVFRYEKKDRAAFLLTACTDSKFNDRGLNKICFNYYIQKSKEAGMARTMGIASIKNNEVLRPDNVSVSTWSGGKPMFTIFTLKI